MPFLIVSFAFDSNKDFGEKLLRAILASSIKDLFENNSKFENGCNFKFRMDEGRN